ncbi:succinylglutamate desuccinylase/aspartoacylase family protein [Catenovulum sp. 2E275]|uniref:succinylglutamate desuccinylase/aspartoacylase domain-containing protein n=1 Tax=Catenovulum sp. 2E275 TaxID=2980497 RepID=UPI0021D3798A|nr:succinylglutamate desuccinylase/aspartoacylase family protein [Catenovulum sp. 2E275]MCU4676102.1 succinylglutamate desuccinylase/aspartoacylase family protein [Catenovulum sp. 2E275]
MAIQLNKLRYIQLERKQIPDDPHLWLSQLQSAVVIDIKGLHGDKTRVVSTLVHGNEPSSFYALHRWLKSDKQAYCNVRFIIASVEAAKQEPIFSCRFVDGETDLNRLFSVSKDNLAQAGQSQIRAASIKQAIVEVAPEALIDMHNTSSSSPAFSVATQIDMQVQALASFFCQTMLYTRIKLGALMEQDFNCPVVTIECGGAADQQAHEVAYQGLVEFLAADNLFAGHHYKLVDIIEHPLRLEIQPGYSLAFAQHKKDDSDVTLVADIEQHNMGITRADCFIGWSQVGMDAFSVKNEAGQTHSTPLLYCKNGELYTSTPLRIFMATHNTVIAKKDCLFYAVCAELAEDC